MKLIVNVLFVAAACLASTGLLAGDLAGEWKVDDQPVWIELRIDADVGTGTVQRNDNKPEAVGRVILKDVVIDENEPGTWRSQVYAARLEEFKDAEITLPEPDQLQIKVKLGFMSRTVTWTRAVAVAQE
jgi:hypothetical protein